MRVIVHVAFHALSPECFSDLLRQVLGMEDEKFREHITSSEKFRSDRQLTEIVERLGHLASTDDCLTAVEVPDDIDFTIEGEDGCEYITEKRRRRWYPEPLLKMEV